MEKEHTKQVDNFHSILAFQLGEKIVVNNVNLTQDVMSQFGSNNDIQKM